MAIARALARAACGRPTFILVAPPAVVGLSALRVRRAGAAGLGAAGAWRCSRVPGPARRRGASSALPFGLPHWGLSFPLAAFAALTLRLAGPGGALAAFAPGAAGAGLAGRRLAGAGDAARPARRLAAGARAGGDAAAGAGLTGGARARRLPPSRHSQAAGRDAPGREPGAAMTSQNLPAGRSPGSPLDPRSNPVDPVAGVPGADVGGQPRTVDAGVAQRHEQRPNTPPDPADVSGRTPSGGRPAEGDESVLESLGKAIASPVVDSAAADDPALPQPGDSKP
ncbi:MAG: hypothetical protein MZW92_14560 [Comamonadaceae bacterium]|nr:hypothetical protein [Comamonadaceae bacterium]